MRQGNDWTSRPLDIAVFRSSEEEMSTRAAKACTFLKSQNDYIGMHQLEIRPLFGDHASYFDTEFVTAYLMEVAETEAPDSWQVVFPLNRDRKLADVVVPKNCC